MKLVAAPWGKSLAAFFQARRQVPAAAARTEQNWRRSFGIQPVAAKPYFERIVKPCPSRILVAACDDK